MKKKVRNGVLGILLIALSLFFAVSKMSADETVRRSGDQYVTKSWIDDSRKETIEGNVLEIDEVYTLNYEWALPDNTFKKGDTLDFSIPKEFVVNDVPSFPLEIDGQEVGKVKVLGDDTNGYYYHVTFTTDYVETHSSVNGTFDISVSLNETYVHEHETIEIIYPDKEIKTEINPNPNQPGGGGNGAGAGNETSNKKIGEMDVKKLKDAEGKFTIATRVFSWQITLGRKTLLGDAKSFDEIEYIYIEDTLDKQKLIAMSEFDENWENAFAWRKGFYKSSGFEYGPIIKEDMGLVPINGEDYYSSFKLDILPYVKEYDAKSKEKGSPFEEFAMDYFSVPLNPDDAFDGENFYNKVTITVKPKDSDEDHWVLDDSVVWNVAGGSVTGKSAGVEFLKIDDDTKEPLQGATFDLYKYNNQGVANKVKNDLKSGQDGKVQVKGLTTGNYYFLETNPPTGYEKSDEKLEFKIETKDLSQSNQEIKYKQLESYDNHKENTKTSISVVKKWDDEDNKDGSRPSSVNVQLYANEKPLGKKVTLNEANDWSYTWEDLAEKENGELINYTVKEVKTPNGYTPSNKTEKDGTIVITNSHKPEMTSLKGVKTWDDNNNQDGKRPESVTVNLFANGVQVDKKIVTEADNWAYEFTNLKKYENGKLIKYMVTENQVPEYSTESSGTNLINHYTPKKTSVTVTKAWDDNNNNDGKRPDSIKVQLYADDKEKGDVVLLSEANNWRHTWQDLDEKASGKVINYTVKEVDDLNGYDIVINDENIGNITITNQHKDEMTSVKGVKLWFDGNNQDGKRPESITVNLLADGEPIQSKVVTEKDNWAYEFTDLPKYKDGHEIHYTVTENIVHDYTTKILRKNLINYYSPGKTNVTVTKAWDDASNQDGIRPNYIKVQLYADGEKYKEAVTLSEANNWTYTWENLAEKKNGEDIIYTVKEEGSQDGYEVVVDNENIGNIVITNRHIPEVTSIKGNKTWDDGNNQDGKRAESITVNLLADGEKIDEKVVTEKDNWSYEFTNLPKYQNGEEIHYTVTENEINDYSTEIKGHNLINHYTPGKTSVTVTKAWKDQNNQDGKRSESIKVQLYANGQKSGDIVILSEINEWTHTWQELDQKKDGKDIKYTVKEEGTPSGYKVIVNDANMGDITITNIYTPEVTQVKGVKTWNDKENQDGKRPESITVNLLSNGNIVAEKVVTEKDNWEYEFTNLPKYEAGELIDYTVTEDSNVDYSFDSDGYDIVNHYTPGKTSVTVTKAWNDTNNQDGKRPNSIKVQLYADGEKSGDVVTLSEANHWSHTWQDLDEQSKGKEISYTVKEEGTPSGYEVIVNNDDIGNIIITNTYDTEVTSIKGTKTWDDSNNQDGKRPESITVNLLADGQKIDEKVVTEKDNWSYEFTNLDKYQDGQEIHYSVTENDIDDYTTEIKGSDLINHYTPGKTSVTVTKAWKDHNNQDGKRPDSIKVQLYADGKKLGQVVTLNEENQWLHVWSELDKKNGTKEITYEVKEVDVPDQYESTVVVKNGYVKIINTHTPKENAKTKDDNDKKGTTGFLPSTGETTNQILSLIGVVCLLPVVVYASTRKKDN